LIILSNSVYKINSQTFYTNQKLLITALSDN